MREDLTKVVDEFGVKLSKNDEKRIDEVIEKNETILFASNTNCVIKSVNTNKTDKYPGIAILTDKRFIFTYKIMLSWTIEAFPVSEIQALNCSGNGLTGGHVQIHTVVKTYDILVTYKKGIAQKIESTFESARMNSANSGSATSLNSNVDITEQIEKLANLREKGILSDSEFEEKKKELLSRI